MTIRTWQLLLEFGIRGCSCILTEPSTGTRRPPKGIKLEMRALWGLSRALHTSPFHKVNLVMPLREPDTLSQKAPLAQLRSLFCTMIAY